MHGDPRALEAKYRLLLQISQQMSRTLDLQELLQQLLEAVQSAVRYDAAGIFVLNRSVPLGRAADGNVIAGMATRGFPPRPSTEDPMLRSGKGIIGHVIRTGTMVIAPDVLLDDHYVEGRATTRSEVAVPIVSGGEVIGALGAFAAVRDRVHAGEIDILVGTQMLAKGHDFPRLTLWACSARTTHSTAPTFALRSGWRHCSSR